MVIYNYLINKIIRFTLYTVCQENVYKFDIVFDMLIDDEMRYDCDIECALESFSFSLILSRICMIVFEVSLCSVYLVTIR